MAANLKIGNTEGSSSRSKPGCKGSVMVETALVFLTLVSMLIGAFDFGHFLFVHQALVERARYAARWGALTDPTNSTSIRNMVMYNQATTPVIATPSYFGLQDRNVAVTTSDAGTDGYRLSLVISGYSYDILSPYITGSLTGPTINVSVPLGQFN